MTPSQKLFFKSDFGVFQYDLVDCPPKYGSLVGFTSKYIYLHASKNSTWQDIAQEINDLNKKHSQDPAGHPLFLYTCLIDHPQFMVALTLEGANGIIKSFMTCDDTPLEFPYNIHEYLSVVDQFAKDMVARRDLITYASSLPDGKPCDKALKDFLPRN